MSISSEEVKQRIEQALPGANVAVGTFAERFQSLKSLADVTPKIVECMA